MSSQIALDTRMLRHTGIGTYLRGLVQGLKEVSTPGTIELQFKTFDAKIYTIAEQWAYSNLLKNCDLWHSPHYNIPYFKKKAKLVVTVHDLIHWIYRKEFFSPVQACYAYIMFRRVTEIADQVIAVSNNTAADLVTHFSLDPAKISVIYESVGNEYKKIENLDQLVAFRKEQGLPEKFFLYVGSLKPHKNVHTLLRIFRRLRKNRGLKAGLVIVGRKDKKYSSELHDLETLETGDGVWYFPGADTDQLVKLYNAALALVHLSLYEGFGLTPLEAMACETPVIASNTSSIPEIVRDAAVLVDPLDEGAIAKSLQLLEGDASLAARLRLKGIERLKQFSWQKTAQQTLEVYQKVLSS